MDPYLGSIYLKWQSFDGQIPINGVLILANFIEEVQFGCFIASTREDKHAYKTSPYKY